MLTTFLTAILFTKIRFYLALFALNYDDLLIEEHFFESVTAVIQCFTVQRPDVMHDTVKVLGGDELPDVLLFPMR